MKWYFSPRKNFNRMKIWFWPFHLNLKNTYFLAESKEQDSCFDYSAVHVVRLVIMMIELIELI